MTQPAGSKPGTRDRLIHSARYLFWERGFAGTSMADLLGHSAVNSGSFYITFAANVSVISPYGFNYLIIN